MENREQVIKHLEIIQSVIARLAHNSFLLKGWSLTLLAAMLIFIVRTEASAWVILCFAIPILTFWGLDAYFLWQERLFRHVYNDIRKCEKVDFDMSVSKHIDKEKWLRAVFSCTLIPFYLMEILFVLVIFFVLLCKK